jgi:hypothetical protein
VDTSVSGSPVLKVYNGTSFVAITPDATTSAKGVVQLADAAAVTAGTTGRVVTADQLKVTNDALATATAGGLSNVTGTAPITVSGTGATRAIAVTAATASAAGVVQLADAAAVTAGTAGRVVDASQLKSTNDALATAQTNITNLQAATADATTTVKGIVQLADAAAITAGTAGRVVTADQLKTTNDGLSTATTNITALQAKTADASETVKGIVELATTAEVLTGTDTVRAVTPKGLKDHYIAKNISTLPALP